MRCLNIFCSNKITLDNSDELCDECQEVVFVSYEMDEQEKLISQQIVDEWLRYYA